MDTNKMLNNLVKKYYRLQEQKDQEIKQGKIPYQELYDIDNRRIAKAYLSYYDITLENWNRYKPDFREYIRKTVINNYKNKKNESRNN